MNGQNLSLRGLSVFVLYILLTSVNVTFNSSNFILSVWEIFMVVDWNIVHDAYGYSYTCGYCNANAVEKNYYESEHDGHGGSQKLILCPKCRKPNYFDYDDSQLPLPKYGGDVDYLPDDISGLYDEARSCISVGAFTSSVLACRKLLMNIAVNKGAGQNLSFKKYVEYLDDNNFIPPGGKDWVDDIRSIGNDATHEIDLKEKEDAEELIDFTEMLLKIVYEFPERHKKIPSISGI